MKFSASLARVILAFAAALPMIAAQGTPLSNSAVTTLLNQVNGGTPLTLGQIADLCASVDPNGNLSVGQIQTNLFNAAGSSGQAPGAVTTAQSQSGAVAGQLAATCPGPSTTSSSTSSSVVVSSSSTVVSTTSSSIVTSSAVPSSSSSVVSTSSIAPTSSSLSSSSLSSSSVVTSSSASSSFTSSVSVSSSTTSSSAASSSTVPAFVVAVGGSTTKIKGRQIGGVTRGFIAADGSVVSSCAAAAQFTLTASGQLAGAGGGLVSTDGTVANALFVALNPPLSISTAFGGSPLAWRNSAFAGGAASFCEVSNQIYSVFQTAPVGCITASLTQISASTCTDTNGGGSINNTTINNTIINGDVYQVNGSFYNESFNGNNNGNVAVNGDNNNVIAGNNSTISVGKMVNIKDIIPYDVWGQFDDGSINYYCSDDHYYYAKFCDSCEVIPVEKHTDSTDCYYVDKNGEVICVPGFFPKHIVPAPPCPGYTSAQCGIVVYQDSYCVDKCLPEYEDHKTIEYDCEECEEGTTTTDVPIITCDVTTYSSSLCITATSTSGQTMYTTTISSAQIIVPQAVATGGAVVACDNCPEGSKTITITPAPAPPAVTSPIPFEGAASKRTIGSGAFLALFGLLLL